MTLGDEDNPVVVIREQEGEFQGESWIKYNEVVMYEDGGHILRDLAWYTNVVTRHKALGLVLKHEGSKGAHSQRRVTCGN